MYIYLESPHSDVPAVHVTVEPAMHPENSKYMHMDAAV